MSETLHERRGARVDYYRTVTGVPRVEATDDPRREGETLRVLRVQEVFEIATCRECWDLGSVQLALKEARRAGVLRRG